MNQVIKDLSASDIFDKNKADFNKIYQNETKTIAGNIFVSDVLHSASIEIERCNTEVVTLTKEVTLRCDRPFIYLIHDTRDKRVIFMGKFSKPE